MLVCDIQTINAFLLLVFKEMPSTGMPNNGRSVGFQGFSLSPPNASRTSVFQAQGKSHAMFCFAL